MAIRLLIADDHPLILDGLEALFRLEADFQVLGRCTRGDDILRAVQLHRPDLLVLDIRMPGKDGLAVAREIRDSGGSTRVVLLTVALDTGQYLDAVRGGVWGIVLKEMAPQLLVQCIRKVYRGDRWLEHHAAPIALGKLLRREAAEGDLARLLTAREIEIIRMIARGLRNREIADRLCISEGTVKVHLHHIYEKLSVDGRLALLRFAQEHDLL